MIAGLRSGARAALSVIAIGLVYVLVADARRRPNADVTLARHRAQPWGAR